MEENNHRLILEGNAFYEIDMGCMEEKRKKQQKDVKEKEKPKGKRQRN